MRLDVYLYENKLAKSRSYASELIKNSLVTVDGKVIKKSSFEVTGQTVKVTGELHGFVGRGGVKLDFALDSFGIDVSGMTAIDVGASTGGFTDCLLSRGAAKVYAVDIGHGQLDEKLLHDDRVVSMEGVNAKDISPDVIPEFCDIAVCDVSFISQTLVFSSVCSVLSDDAVFITLIKPQFECGRAALNKSGIVKDPLDHYRAIKKVISAAEGFGFAATALTASPVSGGDGNREFLVLFSHNGERVTEDLIKEVALCKKV